MAMSMARGAVLCHISCSLLRENSCSSSYTRSRMEFMPLSPSCHRHRRRSNGVSRASYASTLRRSGLSYMTSWDSKFRLGDVDFKGTIAGRHYLLSRGNAGRIHASLLGVGAPEALVIAVVALLVFGPKGLAEVARTLGKSLKAFQPTIQELQQVSREFKSTLEQEIGLDELRNPRPPVSPPTYQQPQPLQNAAPEEKVYATDDFVKVREEPPLKDRGHEEGASVGEGSHQANTLPEDDIKMTAFEQSKPEN